MMRRLMPLCALFFLGCGDDSSDSSSLSEAQAEACEHAEEGPFATVVIDGAGGAPNVAMEHTAVRIPLTDGAATVSFVNAEAGDWTIFLSEAANLAITDANGVAVEIEATEAVDCAAVHTGYTVELAVGTYFLALSGAASDTITLVSEEASHADHANDEHDEHDH